MCALHHSAITGQQPPSIIQYADTTYRCLRHSLTAELISKKVFLCFWQMTAILSEQSSFNVHRTAQPMVVLTESG